MLMWFAQFHDCCRVSDGSDPNHGPRAAIFAQRHRKEIDLDDEAFALLLEAISCHTRGCLPTADITVKTCLDADRLDILRVGARVMSSYLYTDAAINEFLRKR